MVAEIHTRDNFAYRQLNLVMSGSGSAPDPTFLSLLNNPVSTRSEMRECVVAVWVGLGERLPCVETSILIVIKKDNPVLQAVIRPERKRQDSACLTFRANTI